MISQTELQDEPENTPSLILKVDLRQLARDIEDRFGEQLQPAPEGVYSFRQVEPVLVPGCKYYVCRLTAEIDSKEFANHVAAKRLRYTNDPKKVLIEVPDWQTSWTSLNEALYSEGGRVVISSHYMSDKARLLSDKPILPYRGLRLALLIYDRAVEEKLTWPRPHIDHLYLILKEFVSSAYVEDEQHRDPMVELEFDLDPFHLLARDYTFDFTERHTYFLFSSKLVGSTLTLTRYQDYRVLAWHHDQREKQQAEQERARCR